jgi:hypothetical protein
MEAAAARANALVRATLALSDAGLRAGYVAGLARAWPLPPFARTLDILCQRAEQADDRARETLFAVVDALNEPPMAECVQRLREQAIGESLLALERLLRSPTPSQHAASQSEDESHSRGAKVLTLGERKFLARRPDREMIKRLLGDPHPDVIRRCLRNPRMTEDDVVPLAAKRPGRAEVLAEVARSPWLHRPRVRMALVLNPATPPEIASRIAGLLLRPELQVVARSPAVPAGVRALCLEHLARRPPVQGQPAKSVH